MYTRDYLFFKGGEIKIIIFELIQTIILTGVLILLWNYKGI